MKTLATAIMLISLMFTGCSDLISNLPEDTGSSQGKLVLGYTGQNSTIRSARTSRSGGEGETVTELTVTRATVVLSELRLMNRTETGELTFETIRPYVLDITSLDAVKTLASIEIPDADEFVRIEFRIDDLDKAYTEVVAEYPFMEEKSIRVEGYVNGDPSQSFLFETDLNETLRIEFAEPITLSPAVSSNLLFALNVEQWFGSEFGGILDPRDSNNFSDIEHNFKNVIDAFEDAAKVDDSSDDDSTEVED